MIWKERTAHLQFQYFLAFMIVPKASNLVNPRRLEIQGISGQSWCYSSDWRSYPSRWFGVPEVLHLPTPGLESPVVARLTETFGKNVIPFKDSVLEDGSQLHVWRLQLPYVDRVHCHNSKSLHFLLSKWMINPPFQLSYRPLGDPDLPIFTVMWTIIWARHSF